MDEMYHSYINVIWLMWFAYFAFWELLDNRFVPGWYCFFLEAWLEHLFGI